MVPNLPIIAAAITLTLALTGCGQKGPLYLPQPEPGPKKEQTDPEE